MRLAEQIISNLLLCLLALNMARNAARQEQMIGFMVMMGAALVALACALIGVLGEALDLAGWKP